MVISKYVKKVVQPDGSIKVYEYEKPSTYYYDIRKEKNPKVACPVCGKMIMPWTLYRHQKRKICKATRGENITIIPAPSQNQ
jgi:hypothetical protein